MEKKGELSVTIPWSNLQIIASYYRFPSAVFFLSKKHLRKKMLGKTRKLKACDSEEKK